MGETRGVLSLPLLFGVAGLLLVPSSNSLSLGSNLIFLAAEGVRAALRWRLVGVQISEEKEVAEMAEVIFLLFVVVTFGEGTVGIVSCCRLDGVPIGVANPLTSGCFSTIWLLTSS